MQELRAVIYIAALATLNACVIDARERDMIVPPERVIERELPPGASVAIRVPAGEVEIYNTPDPLLRAEAIIRCPDLESRCAKYLGDIRFLLEDQPDGVKLRLSENRARLYRHGSVEVRVGVPADHPLTIDVTAGDLDVDVANCVRVDMEAGDASFRLPRETIRAIELDAGVGDATLSVDGRRYGSRSLLIGAEARWEAGPGPCDNRIDVQVGDIRAELY